MTQRQQRVEQLIVTDDDKLRERIIELVELEAYDRVAFRNRLADNILQQDPTETEAFHSEELLLKTEAAAKWNQENAREVMSSRRRGSDLERRTRHFLEAVNYEVNIVSNLKLGMLAKQGRLPNQPNPRRRAERRLVTENLKGDVPKGRIRELLAEEKQKDLDRKREEKRRRQAAKRARDRDR